MKRIVAQLAALALLAGSALLIAQTAAGPLDPADVDALLKQHNVPGVSIAVIRDFKTPSRPGDLAGASASLAEAIGVGGFEVRLTRRA